MSTIRVMLFYLFFVLQHFRHRLNRRFSIFCIFFIVIIVFIVVVIVVSVVINIIVLDVNFRLRSSVGRRRIWQQIRHYHELMSKTAAGKQIVN